jgi:hypothetical protein
MKKKLSKIYWGGKLKRGENDASPLTIKHGTFQGPPNIGTFHWPPNKMLPQGPPSLELSIGHQAWNLPLAPNLEPSNGHKVGVFPHLFFFSFSFKA